MQLKGELPDDLEHDLLIRLPGGDDRPSHREGMDPTLPQARNEGSRWRLREHGFLLLSGIVEKATVFSHDQIKQGEFRENTSQVGEIPAGNQQKLAARFSDLLEGFDR